MARLDIQKQDTICALATASGQGALAIIRLSGPQTLDILQKHFRPALHNNAPKSHQMRLGTILDEQQKPIDEGLVCYFAQGKSFTGEASIEFYIHGGRAVSEKLLQALLKNNCRLAEPGEFAWRAVMNGKLDLIKAEAIDDLIKAPSAQAASISLKNLQGAFSLTVQIWQKKLTHLLASIEARLDFPDEDLGQIDWSENLHQLTDILEHVRASLKHASWANKAFQGARIVLSGPPNAGKSTLLNTLLQEERAIVHASPGTTRDVLEMQTSLDGIPVVLIDVAGIRDGDDVGEIEILGIEKAREEINRADIVIQMGPCDAPNPEQWWSSQTHHIHVLSKIDLLPESSQDIDTHNVVLLSCHRQQGIEELRRRISLLLTQEMPASDDIVITRLRHKETLQQICISLESAQQILQASLPGELCAHELHRTTNLIDDLLGTHTRSDIHDAIFSTFCIGK